MTTTTPDLAARAQAQAERAAGGSYNHWMAVRDQAERALVAYHAAHAAAVEQSIGCLPVKSAMTVAEAALALAVSRNTVYEMVYQHKLRKIDGMGESVRIPSADVMALVNGLNGHSNHS